MSSLTTFEDKIKKHLSELQNNNDFSVNTLDPITWTNKDAKIVYDLPFLPNGIYILEIFYLDRKVYVEWFPKEDYFGITRSNDPDHTGFEKPDEAYSDPEQAADRVFFLLKENKYTKSNINQINVDETNYQWKFWQDLILPLRWKLKSWDKLESASFLTEEGNIVEINKDILKLIRKIKKMD